MIRNNDQRGFTIVEVVATGIISVVAFLALYIGVVYAEGRLTRDYHTRSCMLLASGALDIQTYWLHTYKTMNANWRNNQVVIDRRSRLLVTATVRTNKTENDEQIDNNTLTFYRIQADVNWKEPSLEGDTQTVTLIEDFYEQNAADDEEEDTEGGVVE
jgi:type II secretory pathway pseudopilin PulG